MADLLALRRAREPDDRDDGVARDEGQQEEREERHEQHDDDQLQQASGEYAHRAALLLLSGPRPGDSLFPYLLTHRPLTSTPLVRPGNGASPLASADVAV